MHIFDKKFREIFSSQIVSIAGGLVTGSVLAFYTDKLLMIPGMLIILPGFLAMHISGTLAARLTAGMFLGIVKPDKMRTKLVKGNVLASLLLAMIISFVLGAIAFGLNFLVFSVYTPEILFVPLIASVIANAIEIPLTIFVTFYLFRKGHDPNNIIGPFITSTDDITGVVSLLISMVII